MYGFGYHDRKSMGVGPHLSGYDEVVRLSFKHPPPTRDGGLGGNLSRYCWKGLNMCSAYVHKPRGFTPIGCVFFSEQPERPIPSLYYYRPGWQWNRQFQVNRKREEEEDQ